MRCRMRAALDADGHTQGLRVRLAGPEIGLEFGIPLNNGVANQAFDLVVKKDVRYRFVIDVRAGLSA